MKFEPNNVSQYEAKQLETINKWISKKESSWSKIVNIILKPISELMNVIVPASVIEGALIGLNKAAEVLTNTNSIKKSGNVSDISELKFKNLELSDKLADNIHNWAIGLSATEGGITGFFGLAGMAVDIPTLITFSIRTIHQIGLCYGYECKTKEDEQFILGILQASSASNQAEKITSITTLQCIATMASKYTWKQIAAKAATDATSKKIIEKIEQKIAQGVLSIKQLAPLVGKHLTKNVVKKGVPVIGAVVGTAANSKYINDVVWAARYMYQQRWLIENGKLIVKED